MSPFPSGSAYNMSRKVAEGHIRVSEQTFRRLSAAELDKLTSSFHLLQREVRSAHASSQEPLAVQARSRQLQRLRHALLMLGTYRKKFKR